jgi:hypothetical protein
MANDTTAAQDQAPDVAPVTWGERLAGVAGVITATAILLICLDLTFGGALSSKVTARLPRAADQEKEGGCGC